MRGVRSFREAVRILIYAEHPVVVACERVLPDGSWKDLFHFLAGLPDAPPFVVLSRHADETLWAEVHRVMSLARRHRAESRVMVH